MEVVWFGFQGQIRGRASSINVRVQTDFMKRLFQLVLAALGLCAGCSKSGVETPRKFTREFAEALGKANPGSKISVVRDLELKISSAEGLESTLFLNNAYDVYRQDPDSKADVFRRFVAAGSGDLDIARGGVDRLRIIPVIKDRSWLEETRQALLSRGATKAPEYVCEDFSPDLVVFYAEDSPEKIRYLGPSDLESAKIPRSELRALACENLKRLIPDIESHGTNGIYMLTAGGTYEASLLLLDSIWSGGQMEVSGDVVVAIPTRDLLLVTGSRNPRGIEKLRQMAGTATAEGSYRLTRKLFVYRGGKFTEFLEDGGTGGAKKGNGQGVPGTRRVPSAEGPGR